MVISENQKKFLEFNKREKKKPVDVNNSSEMFRMIVLNLFELYILAEREVDKKESAWLIFVIRKNLKKYINLWHLIEDKDEFIMLVKDKIRKKEEMSKTQQERRHQKRDDFSLSDTEWEDIKKYFNNKCAYCGNVCKLTYDHFYPFSHGGDFMKGNIVPACSRCNSSKNNNLFSEWYSKQDFFNKQRETKILTYVDRNKQLTLL